MSKKRNIENLLGSTSPPEKRSHVATTDMETGKFFFVLSGIGGIPAIFLDKNEAKLYSNDDATSIVAFNNYEDAKQYAQDAVMPAKEEVTQTSNAQTESVGLPNNGVSVDNITDSNDINTAASVTEPVNSELTDEIDGREVPVAEGTELQIAQVTDPSEYVTVFVSSTIAKAKGDTARMSYGIYFGQDSPHNFSKALVGRVSTQRAELIAVLEAIEVIIRGNLVASDGHVELSLTSSYVKNGVDNWMPRWKKFGWKNANKGPLKNCDLWQRLDALLEEFGGNRVTIIVASARDSMESFAVGRMAERALRESK